MPPINPSIATPSPRLNVSLNHIEPTPAATPAPTASVQMALVHAASREMQWRGRSAVQRTCTRAQRGESEPGVALDALKPLYVPSHGPTKINGGGAHDAEGGAGADAREVSVEKRASRP